jgi:murein DD-endopeptidase MepM/ murein hydrolase activator NlpD
MAFTRPAGRHRRHRNRPTRRTVNLTGVATLASTGVGILATPALAAAPAGIEQIALTRAVVIGETLADQVEAQAQAQQQAAEEAAAEAAAKKAEAEAEREAAERAAREAERKRLTSYVAPVAAPQVTTAYRAGGGAWSSGSHTGIDLRAAFGTSVRAVGSGAVVEVGWDGSYGNSIVIKMNDGTYTQYGHLSYLGVSVGQTVTPGQQIGLSGSTGNSTGPHLHFEARTTPDYGSDIDPVAYLRSHGVGICGLRLS